MDFNNIPLVMQKHRKWVTYREDKHPRQTNGDHASTSDPSTWCSFDEAMDVVKSGKAEGPGYVFTKDDGLVGIDFDKCIKNGVLDPEVERLVRRLNSYTEYSRSRTGLHVIIKGKKPGGRCRKDNTEVYDQGRYFAMTGRVWQGYDTINEEQEALDALYEETFGETTETTETEPMNELVLDPNAEPPQDKLEALLEDDEFRKTWEHTKRLKSLSDYLDWNLINLAIDADWEDQEITDLIISFRNQHGKTAEDFKKSLRKDYIPNSIAKARAANKGGILGLLPFKAIKVKQYGDQKFRDWAVTG